MPLLSSSAVARFTRTAVSGSLRAPSTWARRRSPQLFFRMQSSLSKASRWEVEQMKSVGEGVIEDLVAAQDDFATTEEIDEALANAEDLLHRFERFELNIGDTERDEVMEQLGEPLQQIKQIVKELERPKY